MSFTSVRRRVGVATLGLSLAFGAGHTVAADDQAPPSSTGQENAAPAGQENAAPAGQDNAAPVEPQKPAVAEQQLPSPEVQEALVRSTLLTFSDASTTGDWSVFQATLSDGLRQQVTVEQWQKAYTGWITPLNDPSMIASMQVSPQQSIINNGNVLFLKGMIQLRKEKALKYDLQYVMTPRGWKLAGLNIVTDATVPDVAGQEALLRSTFATFNDANISGNYTILYGKLAKPWRDQITVEKFKEHWKPQEHLDLTAALGKPLSLNSDPKIDGGRLKIAGKFNLSEKGSVLFAVTYMYSEEEWKPAGISFDGDFTIRDGWAK